MANPNIFSTAYLYAKSSAATLGTGSTTLIANSSASGKIYKVITLIAANVDGTISSDITVNVYKGSLAAEYKIANTVPVPPDSSLVLISRDNQIYLEEGDELRALASSSSDIDVIYSWEEIN